jgi:predicted Fe-Mo cluster-binding NifX family protein
MKIAVSSNGKDLDSQIDPRFGRCAYFLIVDADNMSFETFDNESIALGGGAGIQAAQFVASKGAKAILTGNVGPNAVKTLGAAGVEVFVGQNGTVREAVERYNSGNLDSTRKATVADHHGMSGDSSAEGKGSGNRNLDSTEKVASGNSSGMGRGMGGGMGRGMGGGGGCGRGGGRRRGMGGSMQGGNPDPAGVTSHMSGPNVKAQEGKVLVVPVSDGKLCSHFGHCEQFAFIETQNGKIVKTEMRNPPAHEPGVLPRWLQEQGADVAIVGGMSENAQQLLKGNGIEVIMGAPKDSPESLAHQYLTNTLVAGENRCDH